jgi:cell division protein FtsW (lipid II flippase)
VWLPAALVVAVAATLIAPGIDGVHRWLPLGPLRVNVSAALTPWLICALADGEGARWRVTVCALFGVGAVHLAQPDAAQATALACGAMPLLLGAAGRHRRAAVAARSLTVFLLLVAIAAWLRPDPLPALPHVERVLALAVGRGPVWTTVAVLSVAALFAPVLAAWRGGGRGRLVGAIAALYLAGQLGATFVGNYPVPVLGAGAGPVLGWWALATSCQLAAQGAAR